MELCNVLNMRSKRDVIAMDENNFFKMTTDWHHKVAEELVHAIRLSDNDYHIHRLPADLRQAIVEIVEKQQAERRQNSSP